jgi:hypothetical protein
MLHNAKAFSFHGVLFIGVRELSFLLVFSTLARLGAFLPAE